MMARKLWVLAEPETFYLPHLVARLAAEQAVHGIIEVHPRSSLRTRLRNAGKVFTAVGWGTAARIGIESAMAKCLDVVSPHRFYSLRKVARRFVLPFYRCRGFEDKGLIELLESRVKQEPVLVQVSRRVPAHLTGRYCLVNKHCSLLPKYAGVYPVFWRLLNREGFQGVTIHRMDKDYDRGPILAQGRIPSQGTFFGIHHELYDLAFQLLMDLLRAGADWAPLALQGDDGEFSYCSFPTTTDRRRFTQMGSRFGSPLRIHPLVT